MLIIFSERRGSLYMLSYSVSICDCTVMLHKHRGIHKHSFSGPCNYKVTKKKLKFFIVL